MRFFEEAYAREGDAGVVRLEKELAVLDWSVRDQTSWKVQTTSPFFDLEWKREQITKRLTAQGLSPLLIDLVSASLDVSFPFSPCPSSSSLLLA